jgi:hypothetical protein
MGFTPKLLSSWYRVLSQEIKQMRCEKEKATPSSGVKNVWDYTSPPPNVFMAWCLVNEKGEFTYFIVLDTFY